MQLGLGWLMHILAVIFCGGGGGKGFAASGYAHQRDGLPVSFVHYRSELSEPYPLQLLPGAYQDFVEPTPPPPPPPPPLAALAPYYPIYVSGPLARHADSQHRIGATGEQEEEEDEESASSHEEEEEEEEETEYHGAESGELGEAAHQDQHEEEEEEHEAEQHKGEYAEEERLDAGQEQSGAEYQEQEEASSGREGGSHGRESYREKGERTSGYHKVYRKDEFKKDSSFYDEGYEAGHYEEYGAADARHRQQAGSRAAGAPSEA